MRQENEKKDEGVRKTKIGAYRRTRSKENKILELTVGQTCHPPCLSPADVATRTCLVSGTRMHAPDLSNTKKEGDLRGKE